MRLNIALCNTLEHLTQCGNLDDHNPSNSAPPCDITMVALTMYRHQQLAMDAEHTLAILTEKYGSRQISGERMSQTCRDTEISNKISSNNGSDITETS